MDGSKNGEFTRNLLSLQLQIQTLLDGVGGLAASQLLDTIARLSDRERDLIVPLLTRVITRLISENERLYSLHDMELKEFENALYESVVAAIEGNNTAQAKEASLLPPGTQQTSAQSKLTVVEGGKAEQHKMLQKPVRFSTLIDLQKEREARRPRD